MSGAEFAATRLAISLAQKFFRASEFERFCTELAKRSDERIQLVADDYSRWATNPQFAETLGRYLSPPHKFDYEALVAAIVPMVGPIDASTSANQVASLIAKEIPAALQAAKKGDALVRFQADRIASIVGNVAETPTDSNRKHAELRPLEVVSEAQCAQGAVRVLASLGQPPWLNPGRIPSALESVWSRLIDQDPQWHAQAATGLQRISEALSAAEDASMSPDSLIAIRTACESVDVKSTYPLLRADAHAAIARIPEMLAQDQALSSPREERTADWQAAIQDRWTLLDGLLDDPMYARCLFLCGSNGEGKTHFIADQVRRSVAAPGDQITVVLSAPPLATESVPEALSRAAADATGSDWPDWLALGAMAASQGTRLVVCVDDLDRWTNPALQAFWSEVERSTRCPTVFWVATAHLNSLETLTAQKRHWWRWFSAARQSSSPPPTDRAMAIGTGRPPPPGLAPDMPIGLNSIDGWTVLDSINDAEHTGARIIDDLLAQENHGFPGAKDMPAAQLATPFTAWALHEIANGLDEPASELSDLLDLSSVALIGRYWEKLLSKYVPLDGCSRDQLLHGLSGLAASILEAPDAPLSYARLKQAMGSSTVEPALQAGLLVGRPNPRDRLKRRSFHLRHQFAWEYLMADTLLHDVRSVEDLAPYFERALAGRLKTLIQVVLVCADDMGLDDIWRLAQRSPHVGVTDVWFAATRAKYATQQALIDEAAAPSAAPRERRELFALLRFLEAANRNGVGSSSVLSVACRDLEAVERHDLTDMLTFTAARALGRVRDSSELAQCLESLIGCEQATDSTAVARAAWSATARVAAGREQILNAVLAFLSTTGDSPRFKAVRTDAQRAGQPRPFYDIYLRSFARAVVAKYGIGCYTWLSSNHWFTSIDARWPGGAAHHINEAIALQMRKHIIIALGTWYRNGADAERRSYVKLVQREAGSKAREHAEVACANAAFLIWHSAIRPASGDPYLHGHFRTAVEILSANRKTPNRLRPKIERLREMLDVSPQTP